MANPGDRGFDERALADAADEVKRELDGPAAEAIAGLAQEGRAVGIVGRVVEGKIEIDQNALAEFSRRFPDARGTFVAVNAPFDPKFSAEVLGA
jgi:hypothetical protein